MALPARPARRPAIPCHNARARSTPLVPILTESNATVPELVAGDRLTRAEFERRYRSMPNVKKAELVEGVVYMPSPVSHERHGAPHAQLVWWLCSYAARTPGIEVGDNTTVLLDLDNELQPDALMRIDPARGGSTRTLDGYVDGAPELVAEITASTASYDLHDKLRAYRRNGVGEYIVWRVLDRAIDWFVLRDGDYARGTASDDGLLHSEVFPGLWLDREALLCGDLPAVGQALERGLGSAAHASWTAELTRRATS